MNAFLRRILSLLIIISITSCGYFVNKVNNKKEVWTRMSNTIFLKQKNKSENKVHVWYRNSTPNTELKIIEKNIQKGLIDAGYVIVEDPEKADTILQIHTKYIVKADTKMIDNIQKYWSYIDSADQSTIKGANPTSFAIGDGEMSITDMQNVGSMNSARDIRDTSFMSKLARNDFLSGIIFGGIGGFLWSGGAVADTVISAFVFGSLSYMAQKVTDPVGYLVVSDIMIGEKIKATVKVHEHHTFRQDDNGTRELETWYQDNFIQHRTKLFTTIRHKRLEQSDLSLIAIEELSNACINIF